MHIIVNTVDFFKWEFYKMKCTRFPVFVGHRAIAVLLGGNLWQHINERNLVEFSHFDKNPKSYMTQQRTDSKPERNSLSYETKKYAD